MAATGGMYRQVIKKRTRCTDAKICQASAGSSVRQTLSVIGSGASNELSSRSVNTGEVSALETVLNTVLES